MAGRAEGRARAPHGATRAVAPGELLLRSARSTALIFVALGAANCATGSNELPQALPPVTETATPDEPPRQAESPVAVPTPPTVVVIDEGGFQEKPPPTLAEAAKTEKDRRSQAAKPVVVLDNKSLMTHGKDQKLTVAEGAAVKPATDASPSAGESPDARDENWWRNRGLEIRKRWRSAADRQDELQIEAEGLRTRFYAADDPYVRDGRIKPEWDRVLEELDRTRREAEASAQELERYLDEGRQAGALPGWLREGLELEPELKPLKSPSAEPSEPVEADEPPGDPS
jgi:hypothetical protein